MQTAIVYESEGHFSASLEDAPFESFGGHTAAEALRRLCATLPGFDVDSLVADNARTRDGTLVFVIGDVCGNCGGSGRYVGLSETSDCEACRGCGRV